MRLKETRIPVSSLKASETFYKEVFSESPWEEEGLLVFSNGLVLFPFSLWNAGHSLDQGTAVKPCLALELSFETDGYDSFVKHVESTPILSEAICSRSFVDGKRAMTFLDPDLNFITIKDSGKDEAKLSEEKAGLKGEPIASVWSFSKEKV